jgi:hypothetical protein
LDVWDKGLVEVTGNLIVARNFGGDVAENNKGSGLLNVYDRGVVNVEMRRVGGGSLVSGTGNLIIAEEENSIGRAYIDSL